MNNLRLDEIILSDSFMDQLERAAFLSYDHNKESGFLVWTDENHSKIIVNQAVLGNKYSISTECTTSNKSKKMKGSYIDMGGFNLAGIHFHPPNTHLCPSFKDIESILKSRQLNYNLTSVTEEKVIEINPICITGLVQDNPRDISLLIYQSSSKEPLYTRYFCKAVAEKYCHSLRNDNTGILEMIFSAAGWPRGFLGSKSPSRIIGDLNRTGLFKAHTMKVKNKKVSKRDIVKLKDFTISKQVKI